MNMKVKGKRPGGRPRSRWKQQVRNDVTQKEGRKWEEIEEEEEEEEWLRLDAEGWLSDDSHKVKTS
jgi:hypothetical protein